jgi:uridine phosphorylase
VVQFLGRHTCLSYLFATGAAAEIPLLAAGAPPWILATGDRRRVARILARLADPLDLRAFARERLGDLAGARVDVALGRYRGTPVLAVETQMGGPATEIILREVLDPSFHPGGARAVIRVGTCGTIHAGPEETPPLAIAEFAAGYSSAIEQARRGVLAPPAKGVPGAHRTAPRPPRLPCSPVVVAALSAAVAQVAPGTPFLTGGCFSKDSLYAEQDRQFAAILAGLGCVATEMELATIGPLAAALGVLWGGIMATAGSVPDGPWLAPAAIQAHEELAIDVALAALHRLAAPAAAA